MAGSGRKPSSPSSPRRPISLLQATDRQCRGGLLGGGSALDLDSYVTEKTLDGLFYKLAQEEKAIRQNPVARSTDLLKQVFGR